MSTPWERFKQAARLEEPDPVPIALIVDSPWLPGYSGISTIDFYLQPDLWFDIQRGLLDRWPDIVWVPGFWVEYGMAIEPSAFGVRMLFHQDRPPSLEPVMTDPAYWSEVPIPDVKEAGLLPFARRWYEITEERLNAEGLKINMVVTRGHMVTANWLMGASALMTGLITHPKEMHKFFDNITTFIIRWLYRQFEVLSEPEGFMLMDDLIGMVSVDHYYEFVQPYLKRVFDEFEGMVRIYHNDTRCPHLDRPLSEANFDVYQFSYQTNILETKAAMGHRCALMGNVPPMQVGVREKPEVVYRVTKHYLDEAAPGGGLILSLGGGVSPDMPPENIDAMVQAVRDWDRSNMIAETDPEILKYFDMGPVDSSAGELGRQRRARRGRLEAQEKSE